MSRKIEELKPITQVLLIAGVKRAKEKGVNPLIYNTTRTYEEQVENYGKGRTPEEMRKKGIPNNLIEKYSKPKENKISWTMNSEHLYGTAFDGVPQRVIKGKNTAIWDMKDKDFQTMIKCFESVGFEAGARWEVLDGPHYQLKVEKENRNKRVFKADKTLNASNTTKYITKAIQQRLNEVIDAKLVVDGIWGPKTTKAVNDFRVKMKYSKITGGLYCEALAALFDVSKEYKEYEKSGKWNI